MPWRKRFTFGLLWLERGLLCLVLFVLFCAGYQFWLLSYSPPTNYLTLQISLQQVFEQRFARMALTSLPPLLAESPYMASAFVAVADVDEETLTEKQPKKKRKKKEHTKKPKAAKHKKTKNEALQPQVLTLPKVTLAQLEALPGIGPKMAERLLQAQAKLPHGFQCLAQVDEVSGVGEKLLERLEPWLRFPEPTKEEDLAEACKMVQKE